MTCPCSLLRCLLAPVMMCKDCVIAELDKLRQRCRVALKLARMRSLLLSRSLPAVAVQYLDIEQRQSLALSQNMGAESSGGPQLFVKVCQCSGVPWTAVDVLEIPATFEHQPTRGMQPAARTPSRAARDDVRAVKGLLHSRK